MAKVFYARTSTVIQHEDRQLTDKDQYDRIFLDKCSGKDVNRPALQEMIAYIREGDELYVHELSRLGRNTFDLLSLVKQILNKGVTITFLKEHMFFSPDKTDAMSQMTLEIFSAVATFERNLINQRCQEGRILAKLNHKYKGSKKHLSIEQIQELRDLAKNKEVWTPTSLAKRYNICRSSVYNYLKS